MNKKKIRFFPKNKKAAEMTIGTIIVIILALVVLVVIVYGFTTGWGNLWEKIIGFGGGKVNVQSVVQSCQLACTTNSQYDWCSKSRSVKYQNGSENNKVYTLTTNCDNLDTNLTNVNAGTTGLSCDPINCK